MIYDLPRYIIILTFINVIGLQIDTEHPQNGVGKLRLNCIHQTVNAPQIKVEHVLCAISKLPTFFFKEI